MKTVFMVEDLVGLGFVGGRGGDEFMSDEKVLTWISLCLE